MKKFNITNPVENMVSHYAIQPPDIPTVSNEETIDSTIERKAIHIQDRPKVDKSGKELKRKRFNPLILHSLFNDIEKIAYVEHTSINEAVNRALAMYRDAKKDVLAQYAEIEKLKLNK